MSASHGSIELDEVQTPVLIVGGALVGLSLSFFLARQGVSSMLVEKHPAPAQLPRARGYNARTMELFRATGLEQIVRAAQSSTASNRGMVRVDSLAATDMVILDEGGTEDLSEISPTSGCVIGQDQLEPILFEQAQALGSTIRFGVELISFEQDREGVSAVVRERASGREQRVRAQYMIAADGNQSSVRKALGIQTGGPGALSYMTDVAFEADLSSVLRGRNIYLYYISNPDLPDGLGGLMPLDNQLRWSFGTAFHPERGERREDLTDERCREQIRVAVGVPDLEVKILPARPWDPVKVGVWELAARYAEHYQSGRVFLTGDAAHAVLPSGGLGAGTGIQDAYNLAWKLALVLSDIAGPRLLDSYEAERFPIGKLTVEQTLQRQYYRTGSAASSLLPINDLIFGYRYCSAAIIADAATADSPLTQDPQTLSGEPGTRAPHIVLERQGVRSSTTDLCLGHWTLLTGSHDAGWHETARQVSQQTRLPLTVQTIGNGNNDWQANADRWPAAYGITTGGAVLVRPDGFVAWRAPEQVPQPTEALVRAIKTIISHQNDA